MNVLQRSVGTRRLIVGALGNTQFPTDPNLAKPHHQAYDKDVLGQGL
jgi:hypothetical protein